MANGSSQPGFVEGPLGAYVSFLGRLDSLNQQSKKSALLWCVSPTQTLCLELPEHISQGGQSQHPYDQCLGSRYTHNCSL